MLLPVNTSPEEGEGDQPPAETRNIPALAASLREIRPDWTTASIERAVTDPRCAERPWALAWEAAHILAADDKTDQPGRLPCDGPWWAEAARRLRTRQPAPARPEPCGECDHGMIEDTDGLLRRCPRCRPLAAGAS